MKYLLATTNKAKIKRYGDNLKQNNIDFITLSDLNLNLNVDETGNNPTENAIIKAKAYNKATNIPTIAIDDALFLNNVPNHIQTGTNVRRVNGKRLNDKEMIEHYISLVNKYGKNGELTGYFKKAVAIINENDIFTFEYKTNRKFSNKQSSIINEGYPLSLIQIVEQFIKFKSELTEEEEEKILQTEQNEICNFIIRTINEAKSNQPNNTSNPHNPNLTNPQNYDIK